MAVNLAESVNNATAVMPDTTDRTNLRTDATTMVNRLDTLRSNGRLNQEQADFYGDLFIDWLENLAANMSDQS